MCKPSRWNAADVAKDNRTKASAASTQVALNALRMCIPPGQSQAMLSSPYVIEGHGQLHDRQSPAAEVSAGGKGEFTTARDAPEGRYPAQAGLICI